MTLLVSGKYSTDYGKPKMMTSKEQLIELAEVIVPPGQKCGEQMLRNAEAFAAELNTYMDGRENLEELIGRDNKELMHSNHVNHFRYISSLAGLYDPQSFVETIIWVLRTYISHGISEHYWNVMLPACVDILRSGLDHEDYLEVVAFYDYLQTNFQSLLEISRYTPSFFEELGGMGGTPDE